MENHSRSKYFLFLGVVLVVGALIYFFVFKNTNISPTVTPVTTMTGHVTEVKENDIKVEGLVGGVSKVIELAISPETVLTKNVIVITAEQAKSGKQFHPETKILSGQASDLTTKMLVRIKTKENLLENSQAQALEINYITYDLPF